MNVGYFSEWIPKYLQYLQLHNYSEKTIASYGQVLRQFGHYLFILRTTGEDKPVREWMNKAHQRLDVDVKASSEEIELYLSFLIDALSYRPKTAYRVISTIQSYYRFIDRKTDNVYALSSALNVEKPKVERTISPYLSHEEVMRLLTSVDNVRDQLIIHLIYTTGVRVSELCAITIEDISCESQTIKIHGRGNKIRAVFINEELLQAIMRHIGEKTSGPLFLGHENKQISPRTVQHVFRQYAPPGITPHTLRHSYAVKLYHQTGDIHMVQKSLGYASPKTMPMYQSNIDEKSYQNTIKI